jgi:phage anti-repressor protein
MNYHQTNDYVVDLDKIYQQLGFSRKDHCKRILEKNFTEDTDYKLTVPPKGGGQFASEHIMLNVDTFKNLCMLAQTKEARQIRRYYIKLENVVNKITKKSIENNSNSNSIDLEIEKERTKRQQIKFEMLKLSLNKNTTRTTAIVDDLINFEEVVVPQRQPVILKHITQEEEVFETEKHKFSGGKLIYSSRFYKNGQYGPLNCRQMYLESIKYVEQYIHELFYSDNKSNYLCRSNFYILTENMEWEFRTKFEILVIISIYIHRIVKNLVNIYERCLTNEDLKNCEKLCNSKNLCLSTFDEIQHLYFKTFSQTNYMYFDEKTHKEGKLPGGRLHLKYKPFPVYFERKRYLQFIYENVTFTDDNQWPMWYLVAERYMKFEKVFYFKKDLQEIKMLLSTLCSGCILN